MEETLAKRLEEIESKIEEIQNIQLANKLAIMELKKGGPVEVPEGKKGPVPTELKPSVLDEISREILDLRRRVESLEKSESVKTPVQIPEIKKAPPIKPKKEAPQEKITSTKPKEEPKKKGGFLKIFKHEKIEPKVKSPEKISEKPEKEPKNFDKRIERLKKMIEGM